MNNLFQFLQHIFTICDINFLKREHKIEIYKIEKSKFNLQFGGKFSSNNK